MPDSPKSAKWLRTLAQYLSGAAAWLNTKAGRREFQPRPDDIYLASYARSGTTWLQMIVYQLTSDGSTDFNHITEPIPYLERALPLGRDLNLLPSPRIFKTHWRYSQIPKGPYKRIYIARDGKDVLVSCFHFFRDHSTFKGTFEEFYKQFMAGAAPSGSWFRHVGEWSAHAADPNVLFIRYEDLVSHFEPTIRRIAAFLDRPIPADKFPAIAERCSFRFMKQHEEKFAFLQELMLEHGFTGQGFIREGKTGSGKAQLTPEQKAMFDQAASALVMPAPIDTPSQAAKA